MFPEMMPVGFAYEAITVGATAVGFTTATFLPSNARAATRAVITAETAQIRFRWDGTDPTASEGHLLEIGDSYPIEGTQNLRQFKAIRTGATSATLRVTYER